MSIALCGDCLELLDNSTLMQHGVGAEFALTFLGPPFNQGKDYAFFDDELHPEQYWQWLEEIYAKVYALTAEGGTIYFMHRDKNGEQVLRLLPEAG
jgi:DNA methylase.